MDFDDTYSATPEEPQEGGSSIGLFLGLYLLVLAFFIVLVSISTTEDVKSRAVMDSLSSTFATLLPPSTDLSTFVAKDGDVLAGHTFQREISGIFATVLKVARVEIVRPGQQMRIVVPTEALFLGGGTRIRPSRYALLDRLVASLSSRPPGLRYDMDFIITAVGGGEKGMVADHALEMSRAGLFAREFLGRGAPPDSISVGLTPGQEDEAIFLFYVRQRSEVPIRFDTVKTGSNP
jgi:hypothetical protein